MNPKARKAAIVTGASGGIGQAIALRLARDGFAVVVNYAGAVAKAEQVVDRIRKAGGEAIPVQGNVSDADDVARIFETAKQSFGCIDAVVNSAGVMPNVPIAASGLNAFDTAVATNLRGTFIVLAEAAKHLSEGGRIVALSSSVIAKSFPFYGPYIASKAGVEGLVRVLANELRGRGITVNAIAPGPVGTDLFLNGKSEEDVARIRNLAPLERLGTPEDIAAAVSFLTGRDGGWVNAQVLRVNGGFA